MIKSPIIIVDDDEDDLLMLESTIRELDPGHIIISLQNPADLIKYLREAEVSPFIIICDFNMPKLNGLQLREALNKDPEIRFKGIPFVLWSTSASQDQIENAYENMVQGYFLKPVDYSDFQKKVKCILEYWSHSLHPKSLQK